MEIIKFVEDNIQYELLAIIWVLYFWELYLSLRQRKVMQDNEKYPEMLNGILSRDLYEKSRLYELDKSSFSIFQEAYTTVTTTATLLFYGFYYFWQWGACLVSQFGIDKNNDMLVSVGFMFIYSVILTVLNLPLKVYSTFVIEEEHGFNKQTKLFFIKDQLKKFVVSQVLTFPILCAIIWIVKNGGDYFFLYLWMFTVVVTLFLMVIYPEFIAPLFDKYSPLPEGELRKKIEELAASLDFPLYKLYVVEGSKRSSHSNAYLYGFHKNKRIVLFDTLIKEYYKPDEKDPNKEDKGCETDEVLAVLAHELGHWKYSHSIKFFIFTQISVVLNFIAFAKLLNYTPMYEAFGFEDSQPIFIGLIIVSMYILIPFSVPMSFIMTWTSRKFEFQADHFAKQLGRAEELKKALLKLQKDNLGYPLHDHLYSTWHHSHPPVLQRLEVLDKSD
ncbi:CAAX prenyl protease 1 homolog [Prorops nasuta]|uniref:CAAX prenyl protease 1 homolog n=1 Tax=Prorops nasuta TaxID=863751 RepID=UPI0034CDE533